MYVRFLDYRVPKPDIEVLDDADGYPYSSHISLEGSELRHGDLLLVFESSESSIVNFFERVYGFTWPGIITHVVDGPVPAEFRSFESLAEKLQNGKIALAQEREQTSYFSDDDTIRTLSLYRYFHSNGWQPILIDEYRDPLEQSSLTQSITLCEDASEVVEELFGGQSYSSDSEPDQIRDFLLSAGYDDDSIPSIER